MGLLYDTTLPWKGAPLPKDHHGKDAAHYITVYKALAKRADNDSLEQAFIAGVEHFPDPTQLDLKLTAYTLIKVRRFFLCYLQLVTCSRGWGSKAEV